MTKPTTLYDDDMVKIMQDPALWAEYHLGQKPRWYQEQILRHPHNRIVLRCGRRIGKCIEASQRILNAETGEYVSVGELFARQAKEVPLFSLQEDYKLKASQSFFIEDNGVKPTFRVETKHGADVVLTGNHPVLTIDGWCEVDALTVGKAIAVPKALPAFGPDRPGEDRARMVGYLTGCLNQTKKGQVLNIRAGEMIPVLLKTADALGIQLLKKSEQNYLFFDRERLFDDVILESQTGIPKEVFGYDKEHLALFIASLYDANGWNYANRIAEIGFGSRQRTLVKDLKHLLLRFGIDSNIVQRILSEEPYHQLMLYSKKQVLAFIDTFAGKSAKNYGLTRAKANEMTENAVTLPTDIWPHIEARRKEMGLKKYEVTGDKAEKFRTNVGLAEEKALRYAETLEDPFLYDMAQSDLYWEEVVSITPVGERQTYDVFVPNTHNLVVEDVLVHNTWTMAAHMLWVAFTCNGGKLEMGGATCIVATPYDNQARLIFDQLTMFIDENEVLRNSIKSITKNPYYIKFLNGSVIKLFTAGTRSGAGGGSLRGQKADWLYMDRLCPFSS